MNSRLQRRSGVFAPEIHKSSALMVSALGFCILASSSALTRFLHRVWRMSMCCCVKVNSPLPSSRPKVPQHTCTALACAVYPIALHVSRLFSRQKASAVATLRIFASQPGIARQFLGIPRHIYRAKWSVSPSLSTPAVVKAVNPSIAMSNSPLETQAARSGRAACSANARCTPANTQRTPCRLSCSSGRLATRETHSVCRVPIAFS